MRYENGKYIQDNDHHYRIDLIVESASHEVTTLTRNYDIYAANNQSADALAWACIRQDQQALLDNGAIGANTCNFNTIIPGDPRRQ